MPVPIQPARVAPTLLLYGLSILLMIMGCRAAPDLPPPPATPAAENNGVTTLTVWHTLDETRRETFEALAQDFHKVYPDLAIHPVYVGSRDDLTKQMSAAIALGNAPDLVLADRRQLAEFAAQGGLQPLEKFFGDAALGLTKQDTSDFLDGALRLGKYPALDQRIYGMPFDQEAFVLFYNIPRSAALNLPRAPRTWQEFHDYAKLATQDAAYGWAMRANADTLEAMLVSRGSALLTDAETRALVNERAGLASLKLIAALHEKGAAELAPSDEKAQRAFASGQAAYYMGWMSELATLHALQKQSQTDFEIGIAPLPQADAQEPWLLARGALFGVTTMPQGRADAARARSAWFFVQWLAAPTQSAQWVRATNALPLRASTLQFIAPDLPSNARFRQIAAAFDGNLPKLAAQPAPRHSDALQEIVASLWQSAVQPKADLPALLDTATQRINQLLEVKP